MIAHGLAILQRPTVAPSNFAIQLQLPRDDRFGKIAFANKVSHDVHLFAVHHVKYLPHAGFFFPKSAVNFLKNTHSENGFRVVEGGGA